VIPTATREREVKGIVAGNEDEQQRSMRGVANLE
jgi:hypothetical protein